MTPSIIATQSIQAGDLANNQNNYDLAIEHYRKYLEVAPSLGTMRNPIMEAEVSRKLAHAYSSKGNYSKSKEYMRHALAIDLNQNDNKLNVIKDYQQLGINYIYTSQYDSALINLNKALSLNEGMESSLKAIKKLSIADTYLSKSQLELSMGLFNESQKDAEKAYVIFNSEDNLVGLMETTLVLGKLLVIRNQLDSSDYHLAKSIEFAKEEGYNIYRQLQVKSDIKMSLGLPEEAIKLRQEALRESKSSNIIPQIIWAYLRLGDAFNEIGDKRKAIEYYHEAQKMQDKINQTSSLTPSIQMRLGDVQNAYNLFNSSGALLGVQIATLNLIEGGLETNDSDSALSILNESLKYFKNQRLTEGIGKTQIMLSILYKNKGDYKAALDLLQKTSRMSLSSDLRWKTTYNEALVLQLTGDFINAERRLDESITIIEDTRNTIKSTQFKWHYLDNKTDVYDTYIQLLLSKESITKLEIVKSFELSERARSRTFLDMLLAQNMESQDLLVSEELSLRREIERLQAQIDQQKLKGISVPSLNQQLEKKTMLLRKLETENLSRNRDYGRLRSAELVSLNEIQKILDEKTVILEFWTGKDKLVCWKISKDEIGYSIAALGRSELHREISRVRNLIKFGVEDRVVSGFKGLYNLLNPVFQGTFDQYENVILVPNGPLHFMPFEALYDGNTFVVEKSILHYAPSASVYYFTSLDTKAVSKKNLLGLALGDHEIGQHTGLPGTTMEIEQLAQFYPQNDCLYEEEISETYFKEHANDYELIHVASHGVFNRTKPGRSFVLMAPSAEDDGKLSVDEIYGLELSSELVALSACETGLGDLSEGDELIGLSRAFIHAGSSAIIVSLWKVDDLSTSIMMTKLHQLIKAGVNPDFALTMAKRDLLQANFSRSQARGVESINWHADLNHIINSSDSRYTSPYFWAPFIIIGGRMSN